MYKNFLLVLLSNVFFAQCVLSAIDCKPPEWFSCENKRCLSIQFQCDGEDDCGDNSDEKYCRDFNYTLPSVQCATDEFRCADYNCIPIEKFCDAKPDCFDGEDEYEGCVKDLQCDTFRCNDGHCVRNEWVCDKVADCPDGSDEKGCGSVTIPSKCNNEIDRYLCWNQRCIFLNATCDGKDDCGDNSDESPDECAKADSACLLTAHCEHHCRRTPAGAKCSCRTGYKLVNNRTCADVNECEEFGICDQRCINNDGSYICSCQTGYTLNENGRTCIVEGGEPVLVFSIESEIRGFYVRSQIYYQIVGKLQNAIAVSLDANNIYWSDIRDGDEAIFKAREDGTEQEVIVTNGLYSPDDLAVDWVTGNVYFTDSGYRHIGVCSNDGTYCGVVHQERMNKPRGLALLPSEGVMYWAEWGFDAHILKSGMDGKDSVTLISEKLEWPNSLSVDYANDRMYWIDSKTKIIESSKLDGSDRRVVLAGIAKKPYSLTVFEDKIYWSDWASNTIQSCNKFTGKDWDILVKSNVSIYGLHMYHSVLKPKMANPCSSNPCSQLCLLNSRRGYTCACTVDKRLNDDQHTCHPTKRRTHLVIVSGHTFVNYYHEPLGKPKLTTSIVKRNVTAVTYNPLTGTVLAYDQLTNNVFQYDPRNDKVKNVIPIPGKVVGGMDFDYVGNNLYLSDLVHKTIEVYSMSTKEKTVFYFKEQPQDIVLSPQEGKMFVVFYKNKKYRVDQMSMDGLSSETLIDEMMQPLLGPKISLAYDIVSKRLFWCDQSTGRVGSIASIGSSIDPYDSYMFRTGLSEPVSIALAGDYVFWTQYKSNQLHYTRKESTLKHQKRVTLDSVKNAETLHLVSEVNSYVPNHKCRKNNGNCSHVCIVSYKNSNSYICACPPNMMLSVDKRTCSPLSACEEGKIKCSEHDVCIKTEQRCDGIKDCPNGEDESSVCDEFETSKCVQNSQFQCKSGECIDESKRCNSNYDCADRSDEADCDKKECNSSEFQCREGTCISKYSVCDGRNDCGDFSDEKNCSQYVCDANSFMCEIGICIPKTWKCDGENDCPDNSDEGDACLKKCPSEMFTCYNGRCIDKSLQCNGIDDCEDNSDERHCSEINSETRVNCTDDEYRCYNTELCVHKQVKCDGVQDCPKNDDERNCPRCSKGEFLCANKKCIDESWVCDKQNDCGDGSDETDCDSNPKAMAINVTKCDGFSCLNGACIPFEKVCDGVSDCFDHSDESGQCSTSCSKEYLCEQICYKTPSGPVCRCNEGYQLGNDLKSCLDIDECEQNICSQICQNTPGSFVCSCLEGYILKKDKVSCKADGPKMELITVVGKEIRKISSNLNSIEVIYKGTSWAINGIDVNAREGAVYWSDDGSNTVNKIDLNSKKRIIVTGIGIPKSVAVDWITDNVYFNEVTPMNIIMVCNLEQQKCAKVIQIHQSKGVMSIAVDPIHGWLFWSQVTWSINTLKIGQIYRSTTAGTNATVIASRDVGTVNSFSIDYVKNRLYWTDQSYKTIESSNLDGSNRMILSKTTNYLPESINIYENSLYWLVGTTGILKHCKLYGNKTCIEIHIGTANVNKHLAILHSSRQPIVKNVCEGNKCSYLCVSGNKSTCICPEGYTEDKCADDTNTNITFNSTTSGQLNKRSRLGPELIGITVGLVVCILIAVAYYYYQKLNTRDQRSNFRVHFRNPLFGQDDIPPSFNRVADLDTDEHERLNPTEERSARTVD